METLGLEVVRRLKSALQIADMVRVDVHTSTELAEYLLNEIRGRIVSLESESGKKITVRSRAHFNPEQVELHCYKESGEEVNV